MRNTNDFFKEVTLRICSTLDIQEAFLKAFDYIRQVIPIEASAIVYYDLIRKTLHPMAQAERQGANYLQDIHAREFPIDDEYVAWVRRKDTEHPSVFIYNRPESMPSAVLRSWPHLVDYSNMVLKLDIQEQIIGHLVVSALGPDRYTQKEAALLESVKEPITIALSNARRYRDLKRVKDLLADDNRALSADIKRSTGIDVVGANFGLREVMTLVRQVAPSSSPVLLLGETGTGKEVVANAIHMASSRNESPMITMQCGAVPDTLLDSELFGHEKGAFTGASERKRGRFERADKGTLFLDEIGELSPEAQVKLLRVLQEKRIERVGGTRTIDVDVRVIAATHRDLDKMVREGKFREDLWYRINVLPIRIPPLRMRRNDIPSLVQHFIDKKIQEMNLSVSPQVDSYILDRLKAYDWPGNVRELQNIVERALIISKGGSFIVPELNTAPFSQGGQHTSQSSSSVLTMEQVAANHIRHVLRITQGKVAGKGGAAELINMKESTLRFRMKKLGIQRKIEIQ